MTLAQTMPARELRATVIRILSDGTPRTDFEVLREIAQETRWDERGHTRVRDTLYNLRKQGIVMPKAGFSHRPTTGAVSRRWTLTGEAA